MAGDLNAKQVAWHSNSKLITTRGRVSRDYANENSCLNNGPGTFTTVPQKSSATPDLLDIIVTKELVTQVYLNMCSALSSNHLSVLIDKRCRSSFLSSPDQPDLRRMDWFKFQASLEAAFLSDPDLLNEVTIDSCVEKLSSTISKALAIPKRRLRDDQRPQFWLVFRKKYALRTG
jgi:hypothetical protein